MAQFYDKLARYLPGVIREVINRVRYPGIKISPSANLNIRGEVRYRRGCSIGEGANILVPSDAALALGENCYIGRYVELGAGKRIVVGAQTSIQDRSILLGDVSIGRYCSISLNVLISSGRHYYELRPWCLIKDQDKLVAHSEELAANHSRPVIIEDDCWLGVNVVVMAGVTIGKGAVIGANSVVTKNVEPYAVMAGGPARVIKRRLEFKPPKHIVYTNPHDWPYFYSGFEISQEELEENAVHGGVVAREGFILSLDGAMGDSIYLELKSVNSNGCVLGFEGQLQKVQNQIQQIRFDIDKSKPQTRFCFQIQGMSHDCAIALRSAWVQMHVD